MIETRKASPADVEPLIALSRRTIRASYTPFLGHEAVEAFVGGGAVEEYVGGSLDHTTVIAADGEVVGYAVCKGSMIDLMMIDRQRHRRGLGTRLLRHCEAALFAQYDTLALESFADNDAANAFYRRHGWKQVDRYRDAESEIDKLVFRKSAADHRVRFAALSAERACAMLTQAGFALAPSDVEVEERDERWLVRLPGERLAWFAASAEGTRRLDVERRVLRLLEARCSFRVPRVVFENAAASSTSGRWSPA
jgi:ribosomal protein S18 acetylase RimI-like enzyme